MGKPRNISRTMAELSEQSYDPKRTVVVSNFPADIGEDELKMYFQSKKNGGGDVNEVLVDGNVALVIFDSPEGLECFIIKYLNCFKIVKQLASDEPYDYIL